MKIICKLPNASTLINGVTFLPHQFGVISEEIEEDVAAAFLKIEGYVKVLSNGKPDTKPDVKGSASSNTKQPDAEDKSSGK